MANQLNNQQLNQPVVIQNVINGQTVAALQPVYMLSEADFVRLKGGQSLTIAAAVMCASGVVGYAIALSPKLESLINSDLPLMSNGEIKAIAIWSLISAAIYLVGLLFPNERTRVMKKLSNHFEATHNSGGEK